MASIFVSAPDIVQEDSPVVITTEEDEKNMKCEWFCNKFCKIQLKIIRTLLI